MRIGANTCELVTTSDGQQVLGSARVPRGRTGLDAASQAGEGAEPEAARDAARELGPARLPALPAPLATSVPAHGEGHFRRPSWVIPARRPFAGNQLAVFPEPSHGRALLRGVEGGPRCPALSLCR